MALFAELSRLSPPIRMSRPKPIIVLHEVRSTDAAAIEIKSVIFIGIFDNANPQLCKRILSTYPKFLRSIPHDPREEALAQW